MLTYIKFRLQRNWRRQSRELRKLRRDSRAYARQHLVGKWRQLAMIRSFAALWWLLIIILGYGLILQTQAIKRSALITYPLPGGTYSEALVGSVKTINPVLPESSASNDASRLIFSGLTRFNANGIAEPDMAKDWSVSSDGKVYTFHLRRGVRWHDGVPFSSTDVVFTLAVIQNPDSRSPLAVNWKGVQVAAPDDHTVVFTLPKPYAPFVNATTVGLLPRHLLEQVEPSSLRVTGFNQRPVGTGPFKLEHFQGEEIILKANEAYYAGKPLLEGITFRTYQSYSKALLAYSHRQVMGVARLQTAQREQAQESGNLKLYELGVPDEVGVFFKVTAQPFSDKALRSALAQATNRNEIIQKSLGSQAFALASPLLPGPLGPGGSARQPAYDLAKASAALDEAGWQRGGDGFRSKNGQSLVVHLVTQSNSPYTPVAKILKEQWQRVGVRVEVSEFESGKLQQSYIRPRNYDALLYGINVGADPDVYAFWHSSQAGDPGLNLSAYSSSAVDKALEAGRLNQDRQLRTAKYHSFAQSWVADTPAVMLYTPTYIYAVDRQVYGISAHKLIDPSDRFYGVEHWAVRTKLVPPA